MRVTNETDLIHGVTVTSTKPPTPQMVVVVRGTFGFAEDGSITPLDGIPHLEQGFMCADQFADDDEAMEGQLVRASDFADFKPRAEVLIYGDCHLHADVTECDVVVSVGKWHKALHISGDRTWDDKGRPTHPRPFRTMPLDFTCAFGGVGHPTNPVGKGYDHNGTALHLPNVELDGDRVDNRDSNPAPGGFGPINPYWPARANKRGTRYDASYVQKRAPYYAEDFDWTHFLAAPSDQWASGFFRGDEEVTAKNLFASHPDLRTQLPALRVRCFVLDDAGKFREVSMQLDTLTLDANAERISLTWRGLDDVRERDLADVDQVLIVKESMGEAHLPLSTYEARIAEIRRDPIGFQKMMDEVMKSEEPIEDPDPMTQKMLDAKLPVPPEVGSAMKSAWKMMEDDPGVDLQTVKKLLDDAKKDPPAAPPPAVPAFAGGRMRIFLRPQLFMVKAQAQALRNRLPPGAAPPPRLVEMEERLKSPELLEVDPTMREPTTEALGPGADLSGQDFSGRDLRGADLSGANLDGCVCIETDFSGADLSGASLQGAMLFKASFSRANLAGANLSLCNAAFACFDEAIVSEATLDEGYFANATFNGANLDGATGKLVSFLEAELVKARLDGIELFQSLFERSKIDAASFTNGKLNECRFHNSTGVNVRFDGSELDDAVFSETKLDGVSFVGATLCRSVWLLADALNATLTGCTAHDARFTQASLAGASFVGADLRGAQFYRASLVKTDFSQSNLHGADFTKAKLDHTLFVRANLYDAKLIEAKGPGCDFKDANIKRAIFDGGPA